MTTQSPRAPRRLSSSPAKSGVSRREVAKWATLAGSSLAAAPAAAQSSHNIHWFSGLTDAPVTYFEVIEPTGGRTGKPPMFLIHGGAHTGACYLMTADGRPGWAHAFAQAGYRVVIPDWPGSGRSGYVPYDDLTGETVVAGLGKALVGRAISRRQPQLQVRRRRSWKCAAPRTTRSIARRHSLQPPPLWPPS